MLNYEYPPLGGGAANATAYLLRELSARGVAADLVTAAPGRQGRLFSPAPGIRVLRLPAPVVDLHYQTSRALLAYTLGAAARLPLLLASARYDLVHAFFALPCGALAYLVRDRLPYLISLRGSDVPGFSGRFTRLHRLMRPLNRRVWAGAAGIVANSAGLRDLALHSFPDLRIDVIPNGIDTHAFRPGACRPDQAPLRALCVARLIPRKGIDRLLDAVAALRASGRAITLDVIGGGRLAGELRAHAERLGLGNAVTWHGYIAHDRLPEHYARADVFVLPSLQEGMSNTVLEALAAGLPVVVSDTGGTAELVDGNGFVVPPRDPAALTAALARLSDDRDLRLRMGRRSRELALGMSWEMVAGSYLAYYERIVEGRRAAGASPAIACRR